jgi:hypothetical protein
MVCVNCCMNKAEGRALCPHKGSSLYRKHTSARAKCVHKYFNSLYCLILSSTSCVSMLYYCCVGRAAQRHPLADLGLLWASTEAFHLPFFPHTNNMSHNYTKEILLLCMYGAECGRIQGPPAFSGLARLRVCIRRCRWQPPSSAALQPFYRPHLSSH